MVRGDLTNDADRAALIAAVASGAVGTTVVLAETLGPTEFVGRGGYLFAGPAMYAEAVAFLAAEGVDPAARRWGWGERN